jgi:hypothetical protein
MWRWPFIISLAVSIALVAATVVLSWRLAGHARMQAFRKSMVSWGIKGLLLPLLLWILMNVGLSFTLQPFMPQIQAAQNSGGNWLGPFMVVLAAGMFVISSYWTAATLTWRLLLKRAGMDEDARHDFHALCGICFAAMIVPAILIVLVGGWSALGLALALIAGVTAGYAASMTGPTRTPPMYSRALAQIKFGKYAEAELEIIQELEKCEDDFDGWMMMADLYANHFHDLGEAQKTIAEICEHPKITPSQFSVALHRLADWHLKLADDPDGARRALQVICDRLRGTHLAKMAQLRINALPHSAVEARERRTGTLIPLPALGTALDEEPAAEPRALQELDARELANDCVARLQRDPNDAAAREKLARLMAEHLGHADLAIEQLHLLLDMPDQTDGKRAEWLSLIAAWHLRYRQDRERGRKTLEKLIENFPDYPQAVAARRRLELLRNGMME